MLCVTLPILGLASNLIYPPNRGRKLVTVILVSRRRKVPIVLWPLYTGRTLCVVHNSRSRPRQIGPQFVGNRDLTRAWVPLVVFLGNGRTFVTTVAVRVRGSVLFRLSIVIGSLLGTILGLLVRVPNSGVNAMVRYKSTVDS